MRIAVIAPFTLASSAARPNATSRKHTKWPRRIPAVPAVAEPPRGKLEDRAQAERDLNDISKSLRAWTQASALLAGTARP